MMEIKTRQELIEKYIEFFKSKGHAEIKNSSLVPENDPTVLFTVAGMQPLVPFLLGQKHFQGKKLVNVQRCIRTIDIDGVGDTYHHTFFEMLGNWSLGDYFKEDAIEFSFEFLTKVLKIPIEKLAVTCFAGDKNAPKDTEASETWEKLGILKKRIAFLPKEDNWWGPAGKTGPCGPCSEMFYWKAKEKVLEKFDPKDLRWVEVWNDVFMQYNKTEQGNYVELKQKNVDTGMGVERTLAVLNGYDDNYLTRIWQPIIKQIEKISEKKYSKNIGETRAMRIIADHIKASCFIIADGIIPGNVEQGYILRRLIRRAIRYGKKLGLKEKFTSKVAESVFEIYPDYENLQKNKKKILDELEKEEERFNKVIEDGLKIAEKIFKQKIPIKKEKYTKLMLIENHQEILKNLWGKKRKNEDYSIKEANISKKEIDDATITGQEGFLLYQSYGFPAEMILELAIERNLLFHRGEFKREEQKHQELSRSATEGKFKSGLADKSEETTKLHTATHLLHYALRKVLGNEVQQKGSNITSERLRFDFSFSRKLTENEIKEAEKIVNKIIKKAIPVCREEMTIEDARKRGALAFFEGKYGEKVSVYTIGKSKDKNFFSKEVCAGPHVSNTKEIGKLKIIKEEAVAAGVRRIKAVLIDEEKI